MTESATDVRRTPRHRLADALRSRTWQVRLALALILVVAAVIRALGTRFGFPLLLHPDEWAVVEGVVDMARRNSFEPPWAQRPDHVEMKLDYIVFAGYAAVFKGMSIEAAFAQDPLPFYFLARLVTTAFGVATVALAYLVGARWSRRTGLVAAVLFAIFPAFVNHAAFATPDVPLAFAVMVLIYALMRYTVTCSWSSLLWASFAIALAVGIKYPGVVCAVMIAVTVIATAVRDRAWTRIVVHGAGSVVACVGFLFVISPSLFTNVSDLRRELTFQASGGRLGNPDYGLLGNMRFYAATYLDFSGVLLAALGAVGLVVVIRSRRLDVLPWFVSVVVWVSLSTLPMTWERWGVPMWITPLLLASVALPWLVEQLRGAWTRWIPWAIAGVVVVNLVAGSAQLVTGLMAPDTRSAALEFVEDNGIKGRDSLDEGYSPFLPDAPQLIFDHTEQVGDGYRFRTRHDRPARYVVLSSSMYGRVLGDPAYRDGAEVYGWLAENADELATFGPTAVPVPTWFEPLSIARNLDYASAMIRGGQHGPTIIVYEVPPDARADRPVTRPVL
ncbi:MAG TPA: glycosyltransferase family 39 protein [Nocardioides sp.]|uniref:glycosyltransferase family 39 protein n=1 Tax=Nocardioides sp. TaxID=35761 RepID=UPI002C0C17A8|nr:glycosyltransferase family 39 protein [Nocardioides sp.]HTW17961.1 glycosyltransferase family 39 protein [Nocardioides sp.]